ncbi:flagella basal body P-ring formation protein FlgA [Qipengyuania sp. DGS5-3]|uniref:flagella basal body P-ring formation protein FlgA n=1 Tax=Qipengyuania sp. DGS5-3 TaxID=3349632 RepID=UPI0036D236A0
MRYLFQACLGASLLTSSTTSLAVRDAQFEDPAKIDRLVASFVGHKIGAIGGAKNPVDTRLRLAACGEPLALDWYGTGRRSVEVSCAGPSRWRIFVNVLQAAPSEKLPPSVLRGEVVTIAIEGRGFTVQQQGEAMEPGAIGEWIKVRVSRKKGAVRGKITRPGLVVIPAG